MREANGLRKRSDLHICRGGHCKLLYERDKGIDTNLHATKEIGVTTVPVESLDGLY